MIIVLLADGFEEIEALTPVDMLRRCGLNVKTVGVSGRAVTGAHGICVVCDLLPEDVDLNNVKTVILPGGMPGTINLDSSAFTGEAIDKVFYISKPWRMPRGAFGNFVMRAVRLI